MDGKQLSAGVNHVVSGPNVSIHAEAVAVNKFIRMNRHCGVVKSGKKVDMLVIRLSRLGILGNTRPCRNYIKKCTILINNVYYSDANGSIQKEKFALMYDSHLTEFSAGDRRRMKEQKKPSIQNNRNH